jgi:hypothetical protein
MLTFRSHSRKDIHYRIKWLNNEIVTRFLGINPGSVEDIEKQNIWFDKYIKDKNKKFFTMCLQGEPI